MVKTLNTMHFSVMVDPSRVSGVHNVFVCGDDMVAKQTVRALLQEFGWPGDAIMDVGGIQAAGATEMYAPLLFALLGTFKTHDLNTRVVRA